MKDIIQQLTEQALARVVSERGLVLPENLSVDIEHTRDNQHGEFATNLAMKLAKPAGLKPRDLAQDICNAIPASDYLQKVEVAGPGFINFFLHPTAHLATLRAIHHAGEHYGTSNTAGGKKVLIEYVSANPTGPLHIGHGRGAAYGDSLANLLQATGHEVTREYYVNDAGRQMDILAVSIWLRYLDHCGHDYHYPENAYQGDYVGEIADVLYERHQTAFEVSLADLFAGEWRMLDGDRQLDLLISTGKKHLGLENFRLILQAGLDLIIEGIRQDLSAFGVVYDNWFSESSLASGGLLDECITRLQGSGYMYNKDGANWFKSTSFGDEKDRVVQRENGQMTYFASDIAYHHNKFERGFGLVIDIWGADHHGYIDRVRGSLAALGHDTGAMKFLLVQFATLYRGSEKVPMSTRSGQYVTLQELIHEVGNDAARFFYVTRRSEQHLDFDLDLAKSQSNDNPVYYIQYAHARVCSIMQQMVERGMDYDTDSALQNLDRLVESQETDLVRNLSKYPEVVQSAAMKFEPHQVCFYLREVANDFHGYYNNHQILVDDDKLRQARVCLALATRQVIRNGLHLIGVSAPEQM